MFRQTIILAVFSSIILISDAGMPGGFSQVPRSELESLLAKLQNSNFQTALGSEGSDIKVLNIDSAYQQVVAGKNYNIHATVSENGKPKSCCFSAFESLSQKDGKTKFDVTCAQCDPQCKCN